MMLSADSQILLECPVAAFIPEEVSDSVDELVTTALTPPRHYL